MELSNGAGIPNRALKGVSSFKSESQGKTIKCQSVLKYPLVRTGNLDAIHMGREGLCLGPTEGKMLVF